MPGSAFTVAEQRFLRELLGRALRFMIVGMSRALIQGARGATEDIDLWFEDPSDPRIAESVLAAGGIWISGSFGLAGPRIGGEALSERFDVVLTMSGLGRFSDEFQHVRYEQVDGMDLPVLSLDRIAVSKRAAGRDKDRIALTSIEDALAVFSTLKREER